MNGHNGRAGLAPDEVLQTLGEHMAALVLPTALLETLAGMIAERLADQLSGGVQAGSPGYRDTRAAASFLACDERRIHDLVASGRLRCSREGRRLLFTESDLRGCVETVAPAETGSSKSIERRTSTHLAEGRGGTR